MTVEEIRTAAIAHKKINIDLTMCMKWINEAKSILAVKYDSACKRQTATIACESSETDYNLPSDLLRIKSIKDSSNELYDDYTVDYPYIKFDSPGTYSVVYLIEPPDVISGGTPETHEGYHSPISKYVASKELSDIRIEKSAMLLQEFYAESNELALRLRNLRRRAKPIPAPLFR